MVVVKPNGAKADAKVNEHTQPSENLQGEQTLSTATIERNDVHNYRTAEMSDVLGHEVCDAIHGVETIRAMAHALAEALPDDPENKPDPDKVRELTSRTLDVWRQAKMLTTTGEVAEEPFMEQINLEVLALTFEADDPERLEKTAVSAVEAAGKLLSFHAKALLNSLPVAAA